MEKRKTEQAPVGFSNLSFESSKGKVILQPCSGYFPPGKLSAILGPSGSGKTTLLDLLALRRKKGGKKKSGIVTYGGKLATNSLRKKLCSYVSQEDYLYSFLTVRETIEFAVMFDRGLFMSKQERSTLVDHILNDVGLTAAADVRVGNPYFGKGISGGQRRRLSIGVELVASVPVMMLDEPTSGLDFASAFGLIKELKSLSNLGHTIIIVIHQPSSHIWELFDRVAFVAKGSLLYFGPPTDILSYLENSNYLCPPDCSPHEFFLDLVSTHVEDTSSDSIVDSLSNTYQNSKYRAEIASFVDRAGSGGTLVYQVESKQSLDVADDHVNSNNNFLSACLILLRRNILNMIRNPSALIVRVLSEIVLSIVFGLAFYQVGDRTTDESLRSRASAFFFLPAFLTFVSLTVIPAFVQDRALVLREIQNGHYQAIAYSLSLVIPVIVTTAIISTCVAVITFYLMSLRNFPLFLLNMFANFLFVEVVVIASATIAPHYVIGMLGSLGLLAAGIATEGYFLVFDRLNWSVRWLGYINPQRYSFRAFMRNEFEGRNLTSVFYPTGDIYLNDFWRFNYRFVRRILGRYGNCIWLYWSLYDPSFSSFSNMESLKKDR